MPTEKLVFADEEARVTAIGELGDDPANLEKLEAIRNAEIGDVPATPEADKNPTEAAPEAVPEPEEEQKGSFVTDPKTGKKTFTISEEDLPEGFDTPGKVFKSFRHAEDTLKRQTEFIKTNLNAGQQRTQGEADAIARASRAEEELARLKTVALSTQPASPQTNAEIADTQVDIKRIEALQKELDEQIEKDPDSAFTFEYHQKSRELSKLQTKNINYLTTLYNQARQEIDQTKGITSDFVLKTQQEKVNVEAQKARKSLYDEMSTLDIPEFKLTKRAEDVENEYISWRRDVALARLGRPAQNAQEEFEALEQLQLKNPELIQKLGLIGTPVEPSEDIKRYILNCEALDYRQGWRKDPVSGKFKRLTEWDPDTNQFVPLVLPSLKAAIEQKRLEEGYYAKQVDGAFQKGAKSIVDAAGRRDRGAVELHGGADQGQSPASVDWAVKILENTSPEQAMLEYRKGNTQQMDEVQKARKHLGLDPIMFPE